MIDGVIQLKGSQSSAHSAATLLGLDALRPAFGPNYHVRVQAPLEFGAASDPEPDLAVVVGQVRVYVAHPATAQLVVEVSDTTLAYDTGDKAGLYASGGFEDYWVIDLNRRQVIVFRDPRADATQLFGFGYRNIQRFQIGDSIAPLSAPSSSVAVTDMLP